MCQEFNWSSELKLLAEDITNTTDDSLNRFVESELPNEFFLKQFIYPGVAPFCEKKYWKSFAKILIKRGLNRTTDVRAAMLIWLQDINWPGSDLIWNYVLANVSEFKDALKECVIFSITENDEAWLNALLSIFFKSNGFSDLEIAKKLGIGEELLQLNHSNNLLIAKVDELFS